LKISAALRSSLLKRAKEIGLDPYSSEFDELLNGRLVTNAPCPAIINPLLFRPWVVQGEATRKTPIGNFESKGVVFACLAKDGKEALKIAKNRSREHLNGWLVTLIHLQRAQ
jgi:hypothetical protein